MTEKIELGTMSSRGQVCIPTDIREEMGLEEGTKIIFMLTDDSLLIKKINAQTFAQITAPLKEAAKKAGMKETEDIVHNFRKNKKIIDS